MSLFNSKIPAFNYERSNIIRLVVLTALFALVFINIYKPFSSSHWYQVSEFMFFAYSSFVILTGVLVVVGSRIIMYYYARENGVRYIGYAFWILCEIIFMSLFYTLYGLYLDPQREGWDVFLESVINTSLVLLLPYSVLTLYFSWIEKEKQLKRLEEDKVESKTSAYSFFDEKGELRLSVKRNNLLYLESNDNYVCIWYLNKGSVTKFLLRNTLKNLVSSFPDTEVLRCHRSYMVNFEQVKVMRREKDGIYLELGVDKVPDIPISKTYIEKVTQWFMTYSS